MQCYYDNKILLTQFNKQTYMHIIIYTVLQEKYAVWCLIITLANVDQFSKFFHQVIHKKILYVHITKISTTPAIYCHTTS